MISRFQSCRHISHSSTERHQGEAKSSRIKFNGHFVAEALHWWKTQVEQSLYHVVTCAPLVFTWLLDCGCAMLNHKCLFLVEKQQGLMVKWKININFTGIEIVLYFQFIIINKGCLFVSVNMTFSAIVPDKVECSSMATVLSCWNFLSLIFLRNCQGREMPLN